MIHDNVEFHNVAELRDVEGRDGLRVQRVPEDVRLCLNAGAQERMLSPAGSEIRFVSAGNTVNVTLSSPGGSAEVIPFFGPFQGKERFQIGKEPRTLELTYPARLKTLESEAVQDLPFSREVWRLVLRNTSLHYHSIEGEGLRPPTVDELPKRRYLSYGTSITHGASATAMHLTYVSQVAWRLGADLINLGVGGSAYCERELADYIAARDDWDVATLALSVNMMGAGFSLSEFSERVTYMVNAIAGANPDRPVGCITIYPHFREFCGDAEERERTRAFRQALRDAVDGCPHENAHLIEGTEMLGNIGGLTVDLIHPGDHGMIEMGERVAGRLKPLLDGSDGGETVRKVRKIRRIKKTK